MTRLGTRRELLQARLDAWKDELETDKHGMAHLAARAIRLIREEIAREGVTTTTEVPEGQQ